MRVPRVLNCHRRIASCIWSPARRFTAVASQLSSQGGYLLKLRSVSFFHADAKSSLNATRLSAYFTFVCAFRENGTKQRQFACKYFRALHIRSIHLCLQFKYWSICCCSKIVGLRIGGQSFWEFIMTINNRGKIKGGGGPTLANRVALHRHRFRCVFFCFVFRKTSHVLGADNLLGVHSHRPSVRIQKTMIIVSRRGVFSHARGLHSSERWDEPSSQKASTLVGKWKIFYINIDSIFHLCTIEFRMFELWIILIEFMQFTIR